MTTPPSDDITVLIVDDHGVFRSVAADVVAATTGFAVAGAVANRDDALAYLQSSAEMPDLVLMDINLGDDDGIALTREVIAVDPATDVVLVSALAREDLPDGAHSCGARGYLPKSRLSPGTLIDLRRGVYDWPDGSASRRTC